jgi:AcrR family transcriptional regulator
VIVVAALLGSKQDRDSDQTAREADVARPSTQAQRRADILAAASRLMERHDQALLRLADIAAELELTTNAVRYYYDDIDELLAALLERSIERFYTAGSQPWTTSTTPANDSR